MIEAVRPAMRRLMATAVLVASMSGAAPVAQAGPASAAVPGRTVAIGNSVLTGAENFKDAVATCPPGKVVLGAGFKIVNGGPDVVLDDLVPSERTVRVGAFEKGSVTGPDRTTSWSLQAHAVCGTKPTGWEIRGAFGTNSTENGAFQRAFCSPGNRAIGGGAELFGSQGQVSIDELFPEQTSYEAKGFEDQDGNRDAAGKDRVWGINTFVICANLPETRVENDGRAEQSNSAGQELGFVKCSRGDQQVTGTGWDLIQGNGQVHLTEVLPGLASENTKMSEDRDGHALNWLWNDLAVCA